MRFNINDHVRVKLTDHGREIVHAHRQKLSAMLPIPLPATQNQEDADGWSRWQLWSLMEIFGEHIHLCGPLPFETTIEFEQPSIQEDT